MKRELESRHDDHDEEFMEVVDFYGGTDKIPVERNRFYSWPGFDDGRENKHGQQNAS